MDPNAALAEIRALVSKIDEFEWDDSTRAPLATVLAERVEALDVWLTSGGFKPADWDAKVRTPHVLQDGN